MTHALLLYALFLAFVVLLLTVIVGGLFLVGYFQRQKAETLREAIDKTSDSFSTEGILTEVKQVKDANNPELPLSYQLSVSYAGKDVQSQTAHFCTSEQGDYSVGKNVPLRVFSVPVIEPETNTTAGDTRFSSFMGKSLDSTGTVMLEQDFEAFQTESEEKCIRCQKYSIRFFLAAGIAALFAFSFLLNLFTN